MTSSVPLHCSVTAQDAVHTEHSENSCHRRDLNTVFLVCCYDGCTSSHEMPVEQSSSTQYIVSAGLTVSSKLVGAGDRPVAKGGGGLNPPLQKSLHKKLWVYLWLFWQTSITNNTKLRNLFIFIHSSVTIDVH